MLLFNLCAILVFGKIFFHLRGIIQLVLCEMGTVVLRGSNTMLTSLALLAKESPRMGLFILTYLSALFLVSKMFILGTKIPLKNSRKNEEVRTVQIPQSPIC